MTRLIATDRIVAFLVGLLNTPSPTGYHQEAISYVRRCVPVLGPAHAAHGPQHQGRIHRYPRWR